MLVFIIKRLANAVMVMLAVALLAFLIFRLAGDPVEMMANEQMTQTDRDNLRERLGLNDGLMTQYTRFVVNAAQGNFGISYRNGQDVLSLIAERFPATLELVLVATLISLLLGLPLGVLTAIKRGKWYTEGLQFISIVGVSLPSFVVGILLILVFSVTFGWLPAFGRGDVVQLGWWSTGLLTPSGRAAILLPSVALSLYQVTLVMRLVRAEMLEVLRSDYVKFARARGIPRWRIYFRHALRNCLMPVVTMTAMNVGSLIAFALITETVFQWPGMGMLFIQAVTFLDIPVMAAYLCIISFIFVVLNTLVDIAYAVIDPRLRTAR
ncbi:ABC transporter permease [Sinorhizobium meliloti WSM1022]|jgi:peptide/nickel transport system permease protein|uniref:Allantoin and other purine derivative ABC transporter, periplasmic solute-binding component n=5 Tax=Sinorhizobium TaxID=28105 RepID=Q92ML9_RHIME|nr:MULTISPECIES: ABC transporter permease [Sinorhizobium]PST24510.1 ABC transporter permease [Mesorhizobium loti]TWA97567.1 peptide/nickel transport system permease protein [Ensifer sp. SEMIA 134]TWB33249.1 peptide/nickel transport system permease protein [Ensifer sp. SEMIA 135]AEG05321.1 ABC-type transporter, integral membrane subunit [Sinorhizobium meliloti BL225C]AEG54354.1 ABC-type transporter, integral membrane subunit [Sinorhizobium meliloti AK83]